MESLRVFLESHKTSELPSQGKILEVMDSMEPLDAFRLVLENGYLSAPVLSSDSSKTKPYYHGFIDSRNLVAWVVFAADESNMTPSLHDIVHFGIKRELKAISGVTLSYLARTAPFNPVTSGDSLLHVCEKLARRGCHRVPILGADGRIEKIITQGVIVDFLVAHKEALAPLFSLSLAAIGLKGSSPVEKVSIHTSTLEVFQKMEKKNLSGLAICDDDGKIISSTSGKDLKLYLKNPYPAALDSPIGSFLKVIRLESLRDSVPVLVCTLHESLGLVLSKLSATREHRIYVIDNERSYHPVGVISLSDILLACIQAPFGGEVKS